MSKNLLNNLMKQAQQMQDRVKKLQEEAGNKTVENAVLYVRAKISEGKNVTYDLGGKAGTREMAAAVVKLL